LIIRPLKKEDQKLKANRLNEIAALDFSLSLSDETVTEELALA